MLMKQLNMSTKIKTHRLFFYKGKVNKVSANDIAEILDEILITLEDFDDGYIDCCDAIEEIREAVEFLGYD